MFFFGLQLGLFYGSTGSVRVTGSSGSGSFMTRFPVPGSVSTFPEDIVALDGRPSKTANFGIHKIRCFGDRDSGRLLLTWTSLTNHLRTLDMTMVYSFALSLKDIAIMMP